MKTLDTEVTLEFADEPNRAPIRARLAELGPQALHVDMPSGRLASFRLKDGKPTPGNTLHRHLRVAPLSLDKLQKMRLRLDGEAEDLVAGTQGTQLGACAPAVPGEGAGQAIEERHAGSIAGLTPTSHDG